MDIKHRNVRFVIGISALLLLAWAILIFWFGWPPLRPVMLRINAITLICVWALGPAIWLLIERKKWGSAPGLTQDQQHSRDFWFGAGVIVLILALRELGVTQTQPSTRYTVAWNLVIDVIRVTAWPVVAVFGFFLFREPVSAFFNALGTRASKIGAFNVSIELASLPEARPWSGPSLEDLRSESAAAASDSSRSLFKAIADTTHADYVTVNLEAGEAWLTSRLFILAALLPRVRPIKRIVFLSDPADRFVGESTPMAVAEALARKYNWLEEAYIGAHIYVSGFDVHLQGNSTLLGHLEPEVADMILTNFLSKVQGPPAPGYVDFGNYAEHAEWVTVTILNRLLGKGLNPNSVKRDPSADDTAVARTLLRYDSHYVAIVDGSDRFQHLVDRYAALDQVVRREMGQAR